MDRPRLALNRELDNLNQFELWYINETIDHYIFQAKSVPIKELWCDLLSRWLRQWGKKPSLMFGLQPATCTGNYINLYGLNIIRKLHM